MQPEGNVQNENVAPATAPVMAPEPAKKDNPFENTPKKSNGMLYGLILCAILAIGGIGFGVWAMMDGEAQKSGLNEQINALKTQNNELLNRLNEVSINNKDTTNVDEYENDINSNESIRLYYYASTDLADEVAKRYSLVLSVDADNRGFFNLIESTAAFSSSTSGYVKIDDNIALSVGPFVNGNDFSETVNIVNDMGFSLVEGADFQENYRGYITVFDQDKITLGDVVLKRVN